MKRNKTRVFIGKKEIIIFTSYSPDFVEKIHSVKSAKWNRWGKFWTVNSNDKKQLIKLLHAVYDEIEIF